MSPRPFPSDSEPGLEPSLIYRSGEDIDPNLLFDQPTRLSLQAATTPDVFVGVMVMTLATFPGKKILPTDVLMESAVFGEALLIFTRNSSLCHQEDEPDLSATVRVDFHRRIWHFVLQKLMQIVMNYAPTNPDNSPKIPRATEPASFAQVVRGGGSETQPLLATSPQTAPPASTPRVRLSSAEKLAKARTEGNATLYVQGLPPAMLEDAGAAMTALRFDEGAVRAITDFRVSKEGNMYIVFASHDDAATMYREKGRRLGPYPKIGMDWAHSNPSPTKVRQSMEGLETRFHSLRHRQQEPSNAQSAEPGDSSKEKKRHREEGEEAPVFDDAMVVSTGGGAGSPSAATSASGPSPIKPPPSSRLRVGGGSSGGGGEDMEGASN